MKGIIYKYRILLIIGIVILFFFGANIVKHTFSSESWQKHPEKRINMVDDLLAKYQLKGMSKEEIISLLGESTDTEYFKTESNMVYYLGPERGLISIDSEWLVLEMQDNHVTEVNILRD